MKRRGGEKKRATKRMGGKKKRGEARRGEEQGNRDTGQGIGIPGGGRDLAVGDRGMCPATGSAQRGEYVL